jgi:cathepsin A (carboxypeptidase C)
VRLGCDRPPFCIPSSEFSIEGYLSDPKIQSLLGIGAYQKYQSINFPLNMRWSEQPEISLPTTRDLTYLLDVAKIRILVLNGNYDVAMSVIFFQPPFPFQPSSLPPLLPLPPP